MIKRLSQGEAVFLVARGDPLFYFLVRYAFIIFAKITRREEVDSVSMRSTAEYNWVFQQCTSTMFNLYKNDSANG